MEKKLALLVEGGGMRSAYTAGVLKVFREYNLDFPYSIGISAGASLMSDYISGQIDRNERLYTKWITDKRFIHYSNLLKEGAYFGMDFIFNDLCYEHDPFNFEAFFANKSNFKVGVTHCASGKTFYMLPHQARSQDEMLLMLRASSSIPCAAKPVFIRGQYYLDGAAINGIPLDKSIEDGNTHHIFISTRNRGYRKTYSKSLQMLAKRMLSRYPALLYGMAHRHLNYNASLEQLEHLEKEGYAFIIAPKLPLQLDRFEKDTDKLQALFEEGYLEASKQMPDLLKFMQT